jgi:hypothetical protein
MAPTPGPSYGPKIASNTAPQLSPEGAVPAPVSTFTGGDAIKDNLAMAAKQNAVVQGGNGVKVGGSRKRKRSYKQSKRSYKQRRNNRSNKHRRHRRSRRGGNLPTPRPTVTVPQFPNQGSANAASVNLNGGAMAQAEQAKFDNPNIAGPTQHFP